MCGYCVRLVSVFKAKNGEIDENLNLDNAILSFVSRSEFRPSLFGRRFVFLLLLFVPEEVTAVTTGKRIPSSIRRVHCCIINLNPSGERILSRGMIDPLPLTHGKN